MAKQVSAIATATVGVGLVFLWSGLKGSSFFATVQEIIQGKRPTFKPTSPITSNVSPTGTNPPVGTVSGKGKKYCASMFGGPSDPGTGSIGYRGDNLHGTMAYAELNMGKALGSLPYRQKARISYNGKSVVATKLDIGAGGSSCGGYSRAVDLWYETASAIGFSGLGVVTFELL